MFNHPVIQSSVHPSLPLTRWDTLKIIALLLMFIDHAGYFFFEHDEWIRGIGRACAPIFLFLAGYAPHYGSNRKLILLAIALTVCDWLLKGAPNTLNILWTIVAIRLLLAHLETRGSFHLKLHEWAIGSLALIPSVLLLQYGSLGLLIALSGYVYKHASHYSPRAPQRFLISMIAIYGIIVALLSSFAPLTVITMVISLSLMTWLLMWFVKAPLTPVSFPAVTRLKPVAHYTAEIYALHLIVLILLTGKSL